MWKHSKNVENLPIDVLISCSFPNEKDVKNRDRYFYTILIYYGGNRRLKRTQ